jgi:hypothetical protein
LSRVAVDPLSLPRKHGMPHWNPRGQSFHTTVFTASKAEPSLYD